MHGGNFPGGRVTIDASRSSQYVSAVMMAAPYARNDVLLELLDGVLVSRPYVELTMEIMRFFGGDVRWTRDGAIRDQ